jgi:UDP-2,3-diacylglucosamine pyrophosphatase LpxH
MYDAVILSDIHLGSNNCQAERFAELLQRIHDGLLPTRRVILNGDLIDSLDFRRLAPSHWRVLALLRELQAEVEVVWLFGNHEECKHKAAALLGVPVDEDYVLHSGGRRILVLHGHQFDEFLAKHPLLTWLADCIYLFLQWVDPTHSLAKKAKHGSKTFLHCSRKVQDGSVGLARKLGCHAVCSGHTHAPASRVEGPVAFHNSGCWTELPGTYLTVARGEVRLHAYSPADPAATETVTLSGDSTVEIDASDAVEVAGAVR